ncbi:MAG: hypothetical protein JW727_02070 [Candidatus Aenigmarchaeota archaeon]|nr:hypothetical protein [Candidatus Aenigmarchaeota archaeon]
MSLRHVLAIALVVLMPLCFAGDSAATQDAIQFDIANAYSEPLTGTIKVFLQGPISKTTITSECLAFNGLSSDTLVVPKGGYKILVPLAELTFAESGTYQVSFEYSFVVGSGTETRKITGVVQVDPEYVQSKISTCASLGGTCRLGCATGETPHSEKLDCSSINKCCIPSGEDSGDDDFLDLGTHVGEQLPLDVTNPEELARLWGIKVIVKNEGGVPISGHLEWSVKPKGQDAFQDVTSRCSVTKSEGVVDIGESTLEDISAAVDIAKGDYVQLGCGYPFIPTPPHTGPHTVRVKFVGERADGVKLESEAKIIDYAIDRMDVSYGERKDCSGDFQGTCRPFYFGCNLAEEVRKEGYFSDCNRVTEYCCVSKESYVPTEDARTVVLVVGLKWEICTDGIDNDDDDDTDCADSDCWGLKGPGGATCCSKLVHCTFADDPCRIESCDSPEDLYGAERYNLVSDGGAFPPAPEPTYTCQVGRLEPCDPGECGVSQICYGEVRVCKSADEDEGVCMSCHECNPHWDPIHYNGGAGDGCCGDDAFNIDPDDGLMHPEKDNWCNIGNGACLEGVWHADHCTDGIRDCDETGVDCGGTGCNTCPEVCTDGIDNDGNGLTDCLDAVCCGADGPEGGRCCNAGCPCTFTTEASSSDCYDLSCSSNNECSGSAFDKCEKGKCTGELFCDGLGGFCRSADESKAVCECEGGVWDEKTQECCGDDGADDNWCHTYGGSCIEGVWHDDHCTDGIKNCDETLVDLRGAKCPKTRYGLPEKLLVVFAIDSSGSFEDERKLRVDQSIILPLIALLEENGVVVDYETKLLIELCNNDGTCMICEENFWACMDHCSFSSGCYGPAYENWGIGVSYWSENYPKKGEGKKIIIFLSDEGPYAGGDEPATYTGYVNCRANEGDSPEYCSFLYYDDDADKASVAQAASMAVSKGITVYGLWGDGVEEEKPGLTDLFYAATRPTGGDAYAYIDYAQIIESLKNMGPELARCNLGGSCEANEFCYLADKGATTRTDEEIMRLVSEELSTSRLQAALEGTVNFESQDFWNSVRKGCLPNSLKETYEGMREGTLTDEELTQNAESKGIVGDFVDAVVHFFRNIFSWLGF